MCVEDSGDFIFNFYAYLKKIEDLLSKYSPFSRFNNSAENKEKYLVYYHEKSPPKFLKKNI